MRRTATARRAEAAVRERRFRFFDTPVLVRSDIPEMLKLLDGIFASFAVADDGQEGAPAATGELVCSVLEGDVLRRITPALTDQDVPVSVARTQAQGENERRRRVVQVHKVRGAGTHLDGLAQRPIRGCAAVPTPLPHAQQVAAG